MILDSYKDLMGTDSVLRYTEQLRSRVRLLDGRPVPSQCYHETNAGVGALSIMDGIRGFACTESLDEADIKNALLRAERNAKLLHSEVRPPRLELPEEKRGRFESIYPLRAPGEDCPGRGYMKALAIEVDAYVKEHCPKLVSRTVTVHFESSEKQGCTTRCMDFHTLMLRSHLTVLMSAESRDGSVVSIDDYWGGRGYPDKVFKEREALYRWIDELYEQLLQKSCGVYPEAGEKQLILCPDLAGMLAHEAVGHTCEADMVKSGGVALGRIGTQVASPLVSLVDFAHSYRGEECGIPVYCDDEGVEGRDVVLIEQGILKSYMHDRVSAAEFGAKPQGNARAFDYSDEPLIRMRNTAILPGTDSFEDMIASVEDGYLIANPANGQGDLTGEFMFGAGYARRIRRGKLCEPVLGITVSGMAFELLKTVDMVSSDITWRSGGMCGKKQRMQVSMGGPAIRCRANVAGK